jgi:selenocysteine lyase/cysteine desulfurase
MLLAPFDPETGRLPLDSVVDGSGRNPLVAVTGASNALGTMGVAAIVDVLTAPGRVFVDAVHLAPHRAIDTAALGCDAIVTSPYKWYGPHAGVLWLSPDLRSGLTPYKVRPAPDTPPERFETGTPAYEAIAATAAAAEFLLEQGMETVADEEARRVCPCSTACSRPHVRVHGPLNLDDRRQPCASVEGRSSNQVADALARERSRGVGWRTTAQWRSWRPSGWPRHGGAIRAGVSLHDPEDVERLLAAVAGWADALRRPHRSGYGR